MKILISVILIYIFNLNVLAIDNRWHNLLSASNNLRYTDKGVVFMGNKKENIYINGEKNGKLSWKNTENNSIEFNFKYKDEYLFMISINTQKGYRTLMYLPKDKNSKTYIGLGEETINGKWQKIKRNLEDDLQRIEPTNHLVSINAFICRGMGEFGEIKLFNNSKIEKWKNLHYSSNIKLIYDKEKKREVWLFQNQTGRESYLYQFNPKKSKHNKEISWEFKYKKSFVILINVKTTKGYKTLIYTSNKKSQANYIGLGKITHPQKWNHVKRNLEADLKQLYPKHEFLSINAFIYRGEGLLTNLQTTPINSKKYLNKDVLQHLANKILSTKISCKTPSLKLIGEKSLFHQLNTPYIDEGAIALDCEGNPLSIETFNDINIEKEGRYILQYITSDHNGNVTTNSRVILVSKDGTPPIKRAIIPNQGIREQTLLEKHFSDNNQSVTDNKDQIDEEYESIREEIESALDGMEYQVGDEIILDFL